MFEGSQNFEELEPLNTAIPWAVVVRSYITGLGRDDELLPPGAGKETKSVINILRELQLSKNDKNSSRSSQKWAKKPREAKSKVISKREEKAKNG